MRAPWLIVPALGLFIGASQALTTSTAQSTQAAPAEFAKKSGCFECHAVDKKVTGPAYKDVANRYKGDEKARAAVTIDFLPLKGARAGELAAKFDVVLGTTPEV